MFLIYIYIYKDKTKRYMDKPKVLLKTKAAPPSLKGLGLQKANPQVLKN